MKLNKNFVQISATAIVTTVAIFGFMTFFQKDGLIIALHQSERINWADAKLLIDEYKEFKPMFVKYKDSNNVDVIDTLEGFVFSADHLREIVNTNRSVEGNPDKVIFYFGQKDKFQHGGGIFDPKRANMHIIAAGMKGNKLLKDNMSSPTDPSVFDKADPCPPNCPDPK